MKQASPREKKKKINVDFCLSSMQGNKIAMRRNWNRKNCIATTTESRKIEKIHRRIYAAAAVRETKNAAVYDLCCTHIVNICGPTIQILRYIDSGFAQRDDATRHSCSAWCKEPSALTVPVRVTSASPLPQGYRLVDFERNTSKHVSSRALWNSRPRRYAPCGQ